MGLFSSLFTGVSALFAQSQSTAMISNNIANVNTTGYKRSEAAFEGFVTTESRLSTYSPGTVGVNRVQRISEQGSIQQTNSGTDVAISGGGFLPVKRAADSLQEFLYTRAGQFQESSEGYLTNASGFVLYAWPLDSNGDLPANQGDLTSMVPADVAFLGGLTRPTTTAELALNLDASETDYNNGAIDNGTGNPVSGFTSLPVPDTQAAHFSRGLTIFDDLGESQTVTMEFRKIIGPMANVTSGSTAALTRDTVISDMANAANGDIFAIQVGATTVNYTVGTTVTTVGDLIDHLNTSFGGGTVASASLTPSGQLLIQANDPTDSITLTDTDTVLFGANNFNFTGASGDQFDPYGIDGAQPFNDPDDPYGFTTTSGNQADFPDFADIATPNPYGWWEMTIVHPNGNNITQGLLNFDGQGQLNATSDSSGNIDIELSNVDWGNGAAAQSFKIDIERFTQFSGNYDVIFSDQNGAELGLRTGVEISREGIISARFSNGASSDLYKLPLVTFANENGLTEVSGTAFSESEESGEENLREAGTGGAGFLEPSTLEASNVDLADEFARLIVAQRAFGANTRVINTVDQMSEDLLRLR